VYSALEASPDFAGYSAAQQQAVRHALRDFRLSGIGLPAAQKQRFATSRKRSPN